MLLEIITGMTFSMEIHGPTLQTLRRSRGIGRSRRRRSCPLDQLDRQEHALQELIHIPLELLTRNRGRTLEGLVTEARLGLKEIPIEQQLVFIIILKVGSVQEIAQLSSIVFLHFAQVAKTKVLGEEVTWLLGHLEHQAEGPAAGAEVPQQGVCPQQGVGILQTCLIGTYWWQPAEDDELVWQGRSFLHPELRLHHLGQDSVVQDISHLIFIHIRQQWDSHHLHKSQKTLLVPKTTIRSAGDEAATAAKDQICFHEFHCYLEAHLTHVQGKFFRIHVVRIFIQSLGLHRRKPGPIGFLIFIALHGA
mmetsp:Transcript_37149/g.58721  ORF Transcript_37149/g.58721 Transcript_37149/m.58721 type:complete len:306 (+) Transcript_37149:463-1380(+)